MTRSIHGRGTAKTLPAGPLALLGLLVGTVGTPSPAPGAAPPHGPRFEEVTEAAGLQFVHSTRSFGDRHKAEVLEMFTDGGAAVAVGDFDGDGFEDLFVTDSGEGRPNRLMRNLYGETGVLRFEDVAEAAGVAGGNDAESIVADGLWLDFDDDGRLDLLVSRFGTPLLYRQVESGASPVPEFVEVAEPAGLTEFANTIAAIAFDYNGDGWLDLLFGNYFRPVNLLDLDTPYVLPEDLDDAHNGGGLTLWKNIPAGSNREGALTGGRRFVDVTEEAGLTHHTGWSLDVGHGDLDNDGDQDLYVASDYGTDRLFFNNGDGTFTDATEEVLGFDTKKGMNVDMADYDRNGWLDIYVTNITDEYMRECNMLWHNAGDGSFLDLSSETGTCDTDWGWAAKFGDFDNDGWEDLFVVNGLRSAGEENYIPVLLEMIITPGIDFSDLNSYPDIGDRTWSGFQPQRLFHNRGDGTFRESAAEAGVDNVLDGRGIGVGDFDNDGRLDLYQSNAGQRALLLRNVTDPVGRWVALRLQGAGADPAEGAARGRPGSNRDAIGARVTLTDDRGETFMREVDSGNGYASQSSTRLHFGLGEAEAVERLEIRWPSGRVQVLESEEGRPPVKLDAFTRIVEGDDPGRIPDRDDDGAEGETAAAPSGDRSAELSQRLWHHRNLGKALYENPATQYEAVEELEKALELAPESARERVNLGLALLRAGRTEEGIEQLRRAQSQDPSIPHTWFNLGIEYKRRSEYAAAIEQLEGMAERVPDEPITHYNLGVLYKLEGNLDTALVHLERAAELAPRLAGARFQLANAYRVQSREEAAREEMATFRQLKAAMDSEEDLEWSWYSEIYETLEPRPRPEPVAPVAFETRVVGEDSDRPALSVGLDPETAGLEVLTADGDGRPDLLAWSSRGATLLTGGRPTESGLEELRDIRGLAAGDFDDDGLDDLVVLDGGEARGGVSLWANRGGHFEPLPGALPEELGETASPIFAAAVWLDFDHDYDLDLVLLGPAPVLLRNDGDGTFSDRTEAFPFDAAPPGARPVAGAPLDLVADTQAVDLVVAHAEGTTTPGMLYRDLLGGHYEARPLPALPSGTRHLLAADVNHDGWTDLVAATAEGVTLLLNDQDEGFEAVPVEDAPGGPIGLLDLDNRGANDLVASGQGGTVLLRDRGEGIFRSSSNGDPFAAAAALATADFDADGRTDLAAVGAEGALRLFVNRTESDNHWLRVGLTGVKNPVLARGAEVEVKADTLYQKRLYDGVPLVFGLGDRERIDTVRITWPNGMVQNEPRQETDVSVTFEEAPRLSGSCPMIFTWNGSEFEFITDVLGVAPLGASAGDGSFFPVDHDEGIRIAGESLAPRPDGRYEIRMTEELREVAYLDEIRLAAVDHQADVEILTNDKFKGPPFPELRLYGAEDPLRPMAARDHRGRDVLDRVLARDATYPDGFQRTVDGIAEPHHLELDFGPEAPQGRALLVLTGWVDWADGSTFLRTAQGEGPGLALPSLEVQDASGRWVTVLEDMGLPAGKPKTIAVDLTGLLPAGWSKLRIVTSLCVYWDEIYITPDPGPPTVRLNDLPLERADLRFRGFSKVVIHPERKQPERFVYAERRPQADWNWNPTPGLYTRYGRVERLLSTLDDRFVIMGSGDEVRMLFDPTELPPVPDGWVRDFILFVDGWAKDGDANTAFSQTVEPLPYHGMPQYPYEPPHGYPDDPSHRRYREQMLTRPALRLIRPLTEGPVPDGLTPALRSTQAGGGQ